jgi:hypothetical protein
MLTQKFLIDFNKSVGPIVFGSSRADVEAAIGKTPEREKRTMDLAPIDHFKDEAFIVHYDPNDTVMAVEFFELGMLFAPPDLSLDMPYAALLKWIRSKDADVLVESAGDFQSDALGLAGRPKPSDAKAVESVVVYRPNYYEEAAEWMEKLGLI